MVSWAVVSSAMMDLCPNRHTFNVHSCETSLRNKSSVEAKEADFRDMTDIWGKQTKEQVDNSAQRLECCKRKLRIDRRRSRPKSLVSPALAGGEISGAHLPNCKYL